MGRYKTYHDRRPILPIPGLEWIKESTIVDKETGNRGRSSVWEHDSYKEADRKAWEDLQEKNGNR